MEGRAVDKDKFTYCMEPFKVTRRYTRKSKSNTLTKQEREKRDWEYLIPVLSCSVLDSTVVNAADCTVLAGSSLCFFFLFSTSGFGYNASVVFFSLVWSFTVYFRRTVCDGIG